MYPQRYSSEGPLKKFFPQVSKKKSLEVIAFFYLFDDFLIQFKKSLFPDEIFEKIIQGISYE